MIRPLMLLPLCAVLAGCGDSSMNPMRWFGGGERDRGPATLEPRGGYVDQVQGRLPVPQILSARWEKTVEGRLLIVTAIAPTKGWHHVALITEAAQPEGRVRPGPDGVLRLRLVGSPPPQDSDAARLPANPATDTLTVAFPISSTALLDIDSVTVAAAMNSISVKR